MFYDTFVELCSKKGVSPSAVRKDLGISQSTMASWKSRGLTPNATTLVKLSEYFNVPVDYLLFGDSTPEAGAPIENMSTGELISLLKHKVDSDPSFAPTLNKVAARAGNVTDEELKRISAEDGIPLEFMMSRHGKDGFEAFRKFFMEADADAFKELLDYMEYLSSKRDRADPDK